MSTFQAVKIQESWINVLRHVVSVSREMLISCVKIQQHTNSKLSMVKPEDVRGLPSMRIQILIKKGFQNIVQSFMMENTSKICAPFLVVNVMYQVTVHQSCHQSCHQMNHRQSQVCNPQ